MSRKKGAFAESSAKEFLQNSGFEIVACNYFTRYGEIDIVATKDSVYHFIEVKSGKNFNPLQNVTPKKLNRIIDSIHIYLANHALDVAFCVDVISIKNGEIEFFENISA
ncbi:YraN family protein [Helicobacter sp. 23-1044]